MLNKKRTSKFKKKYRFEKTGKYLTTIEIAQYFNSLGLSQSSPESVNNKAYQLRQKGFKEKDITVEMLQPLWQKGTEYEFDDTVDTDSDWWKSFEQNYLNVDMSDYKNNRGIKNLWRNMKG